MKVIQQNHIIDSDLFALCEAKDTVLFVPEIEVHSGRPNHSILAGAALACDIDPKGCYVSIQFHRGRESWHMVTEYASIQKATSWEIGILPDLVRRFDALAGVTLPDTKITEYGIGVYTARSRYISDNPWALQDGEVYEFTRKGQNVPQRFVAKVTNNFVQVAQLETDGTHVGEYFEPRVIFSVDEWKSMRHVEAPSHKPRNLLRP